MTLTISILIIILIGIYLNLYFIWKHNHKANQLNLQNAIDELSLTIHHTLTKCEEVIESQSNIKNTSNTAKEDEVEPLYKPIAKYAKFYEPCFIQTISEKNVFDRLIHLFSPYSVYIFPQVSFACIVTGEKHTDYAYANFNRIARKRVDYAIVNTYGKTLFTIELDGTSHIPDAKESYTDDGFLQELKDQDRDKFWKEFNIPNIRIPLSKIMDFKQSTINEKTGQLSPYIIDSKLLNQIEENNDVLKLLEEHRK